MDGIMIRAGQIEGYREGKAESYGDSIESKVRWGA
jgi:hypothetical protein